MLGKILSFIVGLVVTVIFGLTFIGAMFSTWEDGRAEKKAELYKVQHIMNDYEINARQPKGSYIPCPMCPEGSPFFYKDKSNFCSPQHEKEYWEMVEAWKTIQGVRRTSKY